MDEELETEVSQRYILHWNYRNFSKLPEQLKIHGVHIKEIYLKCNKLCDLPSWMGRLQHLTHLYLQHNKIYRLPDVLVDLKLLSVLDISNNGLLALPSAIGCLKSLTQLLAASNKIKELPHEISMLSLLEKLDLSSNLLHNLPVSVCECVALEELILDKNKIICLPENLVYLPSLAVLSVCENQLLFLPMLPFMSSPSLHLDDNPHLNYISYILGNQLSANNGISACDDCWIFDQMQGCFQEFGALENISHQIIVNEKGDSRENDLFLVVPKSLHQIISATHNRIVPTLREMAMRTVYSLCYNHCIELASRNGTTSVIMRRIPNNIHHFSILPIKLQNELLNGPVGLCHFQNCQRPIFTCATIWVVTKCCTRRGADNATFVLSVVLFCSVNCSSKYTQWEVDRESFSIWQRQLSWQVKE